MTFHSPITTMTHFHFFSGMGGFARGFVDAQPRLGGVRGRFHCLGGVDSDPASCRDFKTVTGTDATCLDLFTREQYRDYHGELPPLLWSEATPDDIRGAAPP